MTLPSRVLGFSSSGPLLAGLLAFTAVMLVVMLMVVTYRLRNEQKMKVLRLKDSRLIPSLTLREGHFWMLFISHT